MGLMKKELIIIFMLFYAAAFGQQDGGISGVLLDSLTHEPVVLATVRLMDGKQNPVQHLFTDSTGRFAFHDIPAGRYALHFSMVGYHSRQSPVFEWPDSTMTVPREYLLVAASHRLETVTISAQRPLVIPRTDGFSYDAAQDVPIAGETATDLLRKLPGVEVNPDGTPLMRGSSRIRVFIDGKPSTAYSASVGEALLQIPVENIARVEIITRPSARYDAEGTDGVIHIVTRKPAEDGSSGSFNGFLGNRNRQLSGNLTLRKSAWIIHGGAGYVDNTNRLTSTLRRTGQTVAQGTDLFQQQTTNSATTNWNARVNTNWLADSLTTLNFSYGYSKRSDESGMEMENFLSVNNEAADRFTRYTDNPSGRYLHTLNSGVFRKSCDKSAEYSFMAGWFYQKLESSYVLNQVRSGYTDYREANRTLTGNRELALQADVTKKIRKTMELETGIKTEFRRFSNYRVSEVFDFSRGIYVPDDERTDRFYFDRVLLAAYVSYTAKLGEWELKAGGRYEHTHWPLHFGDTSITAQTYRNLLPNLMINRQVSPAHSFNAGYARKLLRPYFVYLNPIPNYIDSLNLEYGNPYLRPMITHQYDVTHTYQKSRWLVSTAFFIHQTNNSIETIRLLKPGGRVENTYENIGKLHTTGASLTLAFTTKQFTFRTNNTLRHLVFDSGSRFPARKGLAGSHGINLSYKPTNTFNINAYLSLNTRTVTLLGIRTGWQSYGLTVNKDFPGKKLSISLRAINFLTPYQSIREESSAADFYQLMQTRYINRFFRLGFTYKFGKKEIRVPVTNTISGEN